MRIVSLLPSATEIVYSLGLENELAGVTFECDFPPQARSKPVVSNTSLDLEEEPTAAEIDRAVGEKAGRGEYLYTLDDDLIRDIQPDLILAQDLCRVCAVPSGQVNEALDKLGCTSEVISLDPNTVEDIISDIERVGRAAGAEERARALVAELRRRVSDIRTTSEGLPRVRTLTLEWADPPFVGGHWVPEMVELAGGRDVLGRVGESSRRSTWGEVLEADPDVIVFMPCGYDLDGALRQASDLPALGAPMFAVDASAYFSRPGPRIVDGVEILAWVLHPDAFPTPPPGRVAPVA
ncbi:MAG: cobalamin-binding protein [Actinomycetota bacterium]